MSSQNLQFKNCDCTVRALRFSPNWIKFKTLSENRVSLWQFCSILTVFHSFFNYGWTLALQLTRVDFSLVIWLFWHPGTPGSTSIVEWNKFWSFRSLYIPFLGLSKWGPWEALFPFHFKRSHRPCSQLLFYMLLSSQIMTKNKKWKHKNT